MMEKKTSLTGKTSGKLVYIVPNIYIQSCSEREDSEINKDIVHDISHFAEFDGDQNPRSYFRQGTVMYEGMILSYLWITHALPLNPKNKRKQYVGFKKINQAYDVLAEEADLDFLVSTCSASFRPELMQKRYGFSEVFNARGLQKVDEGVSQSVLFHAYIKDLTGKINTEDYFTIYRMLFPDNDLVEAYAGLRGDLPNIEAFESRVSEQ